MANNSYKMELGVHVKTSEIREQISKYNTNSNNAKLKLGIKLNTDDLKQQINKLNLGGTGKGKGIAIPVNTQSLEASLKEVKGIIADIKTSMGTLDGGDMKSLLSSVNQIATALGKAENESDNLVKSLNALSKKDFNINLGIDMNKKGLNTIGYGRAARKQVIPELESQIKYLENLFGGQQATMNKLASQGRNVGFDIFTDFGDFNSDSAIKKMEAMEKYINSLKKLAAIDNVNLDGFNEIHKDASALINDITGIENAVDKAGDVPEKLKNLFGGGVDGEGLSKQLDSIVTDLSEIKTVIQGISSGVSLEGLTQSFDRLSDTIEKLVQNANQVKVALGDGLTGVVDVGTGEVSQIEKVSQSFREAANEAKKLDNISIDISDGNIDELKTALRNLNIDDASIENATKELNELNIVAKNVSGTFKDGNLVKLDIKGIQTVENGLERVATITKTFGKDSVTTSERYSQSLDKIAVAADKVNKKLQSGKKGHTKFDVEIGDVESKFERLSDKSTELRSKIDLLNQEFVNIKTASAKGDVDALVAANERYEDILQDVNNQLKLQRQAEQQAYNTKDLDLRKKAASLDIDNYLNNNTRAAKECGDQLRRLQREIDACDDSNAFKNLERQISNVKKKANLTLDSNTQSFGDKIKKQWQQYSSYLSVSSLFMYAEQALRSMFEQVKLIDSAMTELKKVTNETDAAYKEFLTNAATRSREIGTTIDGLVSSTADFARLGYGFKDAQGLAEVANIYAVVGDEIDGVEQATESLISTMAAFKDSANDMSNSDFAMSIIDKFNEIGNNFAISSGGIGEALERSASSLDAANNTIDESIALITASNQVVQDPATVGQALKTISMRIRGAKTELEEAGEETDGMVDSTAKLREEIMALSGVDIMLDANNFKSTYQIMDELAAKWQDLTDIQQASITELIAGKRQGNIVSSLMNNFDTARDALETSLNSSGSAMQEHEKWQQSLEAQINKLKASWQSLSQAFLSSDFLKGALDAVIKLVDGLTGLIDTFGALPTLLGTVAAGMSMFKNKGLFTFDKDAKSIQLLGAQLTGLKGKYIQIQTAIDRYNSMSSKSVSFQEKYNKAIQNSNTSFGKYVSGLNGAKASMVGYGVSLVGAKIKTVALQVATTALNTALSMGISLIIDLVFSAISSWINAEEELAEKVDELTSKYKEQHNELKKLKGDYDTSNESSMISKYEKLSKGVDGLGRNISLTADEYSEYQSIVNSIAEQIPSLVSGYDEQGNAILSVKGNVEELVKAYEKLIHAQNNKILNNAGDIAEDFENVVDDNKGSGWWGAIFDTEGSKKLNAKHVGLLKELYDNHITDADAIDKILDEYYGTEGTAIMKAGELTSKLEDAGIEGANYWTNTMDDLEEVLANAVKNEPEKIASIISEATEVLETEIEGQKSVAQAVLSEAFDVSNAISGLNYGNISEDLQNVANQVVSNLDYDFFANLQEQGKTVEQWTKEMLSQLNSISEVDNKQIETGFELQTQFNGGDISYGEYVKNLRDVEKTIDGLNLKDEVKEQLKLSLSLDENGVIDQYDALVERLTSKKDGLGLGLDEKAVKDFLNSLSAEELAVATKIIPNLDAGTTLDEIQALIDEQLATEFTFSIEVQTEGVEALNAALEESRSAAGLTSESISALKSRYEDLDGFNAAALFEKTANGIHLNSKELSRLEEQYINTNKLDIEKNLNTLVTKYNDLTEEIKGCTDAQEKENLQLQADAYKDKIDELSTLASQYDGLTSAFAKWQTALEGAEEGDNYDSLYENLEGIKELYDKGLVGTDKFKTAVQLMTNKDLANADIDEIVNAYKKGYPKMQRYFTEGQKGCKRFLNDVRNLNSEWAHMNKDGSWEINFNAEEVAKELGVSIDFVLQIAKKLKDYGFEVNLEDSSVDNLKTKIEQTEAKLKELGQTPVDINVDIEASSENLGKIDSEIEKAKSKIQEINNSSVEPKVKTAQLEDAQAKLETLIDKKIEASQPAFMSLNTSQVNASLVDALEKIQSYQNAINEVNKLSELKEAGITIDDSQLKTAKEKVDECAKAIQGLDGDVKVAIGLEEDGSVDSIKKAFEEGKVKIDANTDPALTKIEQLAENVERIEDKDVTINVTVNGLDQVKELNKQIDLATNIQGDIDELSEYVKSAKTLNEIGNNITSYVDANIKGNVIETPEYEINNLKVFSDSIKDLKDIGSFTSSVKADIKGNVIETPEYEINNLKVFTDSAKDIKTFKGDISSKITADIGGSVFDRYESTINNLKVFIDSAKGIKAFEGDINSKITADVEGDVFDKNESTINNLKTFVDSAKGIKEFEGNIISNITANTLGSVFTDYESSINNLKVFIDSAKGIKDIEGNIVSNITANTLGNAFTDSEGTIDNLKVFIDSAKGIKDIEGNIVSNITANTLGDVFTDNESSINNLRVFIDSAKGIKEFEGDIVSNITANTLGSVFEDNESTINNLKTFVDSAKGVKDIEGNITSNITADINGSVFDRYESTINNLKVFTDSAKDIKSLQGNISSEITADINGNAFDESEGTIDNLKTFVDSAKGIKNVQGEISSKITADVYGNVFDKWETTIDNLNTFVDSAQGINGIQGDISSKITADVAGNIFGDGADTKLSSLSEFKSLVNGMTNQDVTVSVTAKVDSENVNKAIQLLKNVSSSGVFKDYKATVQVGAKIATIDDTTVKNYIAREKTANGKVKWANDESLVNQFKQKIHEATGKVKWDDDTSKLKKTFTANGTVNWTSGNNVKVKVVSNAQGTANADGTATGRAFARGNWGIKGNGVALGGELGREIVVRDGKFFTIGDNGAEFFRYKKNDIVFNATQTEALFKYGGIKGANPRGKMLATGSAFVEGGPFVTGGGKFYNSTTGESYGSTSDSSSDSSKDFEEIYDWIETILDRVERSIDKFDQQANNIYKSWSSRNTALQNQISEVNKEIGLQQQAKNKYMAAANGVGLSESWAKKVRIGQIDFDKITDETLAEKIKSYQDYYNKVLDCEDAIRELQETESKLYAQRFENIQTQYDAIFQGYEHTEAMLNEYISQAEEQGHIVSTKYYNALISNEKQNIAELKKEQSDLIKARDEAVANGTITRYSEDWYDMCQEIDSVTQAIEEGTTALIEYNNAIREIDWQKFDLIQERISDITAESEFLIELMSNKDLFDDKGKLTEQGAATIGLHTLNYNTSMYQADDYGKEIAEIDKQLAQGYDQNLEERRRDLLELQRESILAAEEEKNTIKDLVEEGINLELDALQERIDLHNEELDSMKDLYDYQKNVEEQTKNIASLRKQLGAYEGFDDEETRAKIQELKVSLEEAEADLKETEYDKFISDQTALLDTLYTDYETVLNGRLDNIDFLLQGVIDGINAAAGEEGAIATALGEGGAITKAIVNAIGENGTIKTILNTEANNVGTTLSTAMNNIWSVGEGNAKSILTKYGDGFQNQQTTTNTVLNGIKANVDRMVDDVDKDAQKKVATNKTTTSAKKDPTKDTTVTKKPTTTTNKTNTNKSSGDGKAKVGDKVKFVSGKYYYDSQGKQPLGSKHQGKQVYITKINTAKWATHPYHISTGSKLGSGDLGWLKLNQLSGYATGKKKISGTQYAWTQENGQEYIVRPSDGAILTPIAKGDSVLNATASGNIWSMANNPAEFIKDNLKLDTANVPNGANVQSNYTQNFDKVIFNMPNVKNYNELVSEMQRDPKFEKLILAMTVDQIAGKSKLAKNKAIR